MFHRVSKFFLKPRFERRHFSEPIAADIFHLSEVVEDFAETVERVGQRHEEPFARAFTFTERLEAALCFLIDHSIVSGLSLI